ncbi:hypothetical protein ALC60_12984, partial [Trachymyrmex zeteki]
SDNPIIRQPPANILETEFSSPDGGRRPRVRPPLRDVYPTPVARVSTRSGGDAQDEGESRDDACMRGEMSFPARGNLRLVAIGGSKLAREAVGDRVAPTKGAEGREREREDARGESAQSTSGGQKKRGTVFTLSRTCMRRTVNRDTRACTHYVQNSWQNTAIYSKAYASH